MTDELKFVAAYEGTENIYCIDYQEELDDDGIEQCVYSSWEDY